MLGLTCRLLPLSLGALPAAPTCLHIAPLQTWERQANPLCLVPWITVTPAWPTRQLMASRSTGRTLQLQVIAKALVQQQVPSPHLHPLQEYAAWLEQGQQGQGCQDQEEGGCLLPTKATATRAQLYCHCCSNKRPVAGHSKQAGRKHCRVWGDRSSNIWKCLAMQEVHMRLTSAGSFLCCDVPWLTFMDLKLTRCCGSSGWPKEGNGC
jgi:hypothetical protein